MTFVKLEDAVKAVGNVEASKVNTKLAVLAEAVEALRSLPTNDGVTDEMADVALWTWRQHLRFHTVADENGDPVFKSTVKEAMRAALEAALGATVSDGWEDIATANECPENDYVTVWCQCEDSGVRWTTAACHMGNGEWFNDLEGYIPVKGWRPLPAPPAC